MFPLCAMCSQPFFECDLHEGWCITCWARDSAYFRQRDKETRAASDAFGAGYMAAHELIVERGEQDTRLLANPYDMATQPRQYGEWMKGRDARLGAYQLFLREAAAEALRGGDVTPGVTGGGRGA